MATKKRQSTAKVELDAKTALRFESLLRDALVDSSVADKKENKKIPTMAAASVKLDPATIARFTEHLRNGLLASGAISEADKREVDNMTKKVKTRRAK